MSKKRIEWLDICKAINIILVVIFHVVGGYTGEYNIPQHESFINNTLFVIGSFHMQLFFILCGYTYAIGRKIENNGQFNELVNKKTKRLLYPYFIFSIIQIILKLPFQGQINSVLSWKDIPLIIVKPIDQFWFIYVLFFVTVLYALLEWKIEHKGLMSTVVFAFVGGGLYRATSSKHSAF